MTTRDIALEMLIERALGKSDQRLLRLMTKRVGVALTALGTGVLSATTTGHTRIWLGDQITR